MRTKAGLFMASEGVDNMEAKGDDGVRVAHVTRTCGCEVGYARCVAWAGGEMGRRH